MKAREIAAQLLKYPNDDVVFSFWVVGQDGAEGEAILEWDGIDEATDPGEPVVVDLRLTGGSAIETASIKQ
jgi:hypothetical protein